MERVRQSKLKLAKAIGTAGYYHTTVIDMRGLNAVFLKHRGVIQRTSMRRSPFGVCLCVCQRPCARLLPRVAQRGITGLLLRTS